jgi:hypothetical protein
MVFNFNFQSNKQKYVLDSSINLLKPTGYMHQQV